MDDTLEILAKETTLNITRKEKWKLLASTGKYYGAKAAALGS